jgi:hypothetical protein
MEQIDFRARRTSIRLAFADHMNRFVAGDRAPSAPKRTEMLAGANPAFDGPVILFENIIKVLHRSMPAILLQSTLGFELHNCRWITGVLVGIDDPRHSMALPSQSFAQKALSRRCIAFGREQEVDRRTVGVHCAI